MNSSRTTNGSRSKKKRATNEYKKSVIPSWCDGFFYSIMNRAADVKAVFFEGFKDTAADSGLFSGENSG